MCGIFGISFTKDSTVSPEACGNIYKKLFLLSERRGKEAAGFAVRSGNEITVCKSPFPASEVIKTPAFKNSCTWKRNSVAFPIMAIGHSRLVTHGSEDFNANNQPVIRDGLVAVHNGIVVNYEELWKKYPGEKRTSDLDTEIILMLIRKFFMEQKNLRTAISKLYQEIYGMTSVAVIFEELNNLLLATNNGSLYFLHRESAGIFVFASEHAILQDLLKQTSLHKIFKESDIMHLEARNGLLLAPTDNKILVFPFGRETQKSLPIREVPPATISDISEKNEVVVKHFNFATYSSHTEISQEFKDHFSASQEKISHLRRCTKCILPETFPFIEFDSEGVCNYCRNYKKIKFKGEKEFEKKLEPFRKIKERQNCLVGLSGGRDSSYVLYYIKEVLGMNPIAFSYDWGMLTDLGRRNQSRMCGGLGVEHILVSADIRKKRDNIRKNVLAWLRKPHLGMIPLFMAGDKQYFYHAHRLMKEYNLPIAIFGENLFETTFFKYGFCGVKPKFFEKKAFAIPFVSKFRLIFFYAKEFLRNPAYLNSSLLDTAHGFFSTYFLPHNYLNFFQYFLWEEKKVMETLRDKFDWEISPDTDSTWRIGDGTASFYNYIYYAVAGFSEIDTFRSNQIREGVITREEAFAFSRKENQPRYDSIAWYCDTIGIDFESTMKKINMIQTLYK